MEKGPAKPLLFTIYRGKPVGLRFAQMETKPPEWEIPFEFSMYYLCSSLYTVWLLVQDLELVEKKSMEHNFPFGYSDWQFWTSSQKEIFRWGKTKIAGIFVFLGGGGKWLTLVVVIHLYGQTRRVTFGKMVNKIQEW